MYPPPLKLFPHLWVYVGGPNCATPLPPQILGQSKPLKWSSSLSVSGYFTAGLKKNGPKAPELWEVAPHILFLRSMS